MKDAARLDETLQQESKTDADLGKLADNHVNNKAMSKLLKRIELSVIKGRYFGNALF